MAVAEKRKKTVSESGQLSWKDAAALDAWRPVRINLGKDVFGKNIREDEMLLSPK
jgi:hypothetical protein